MRRGKITCPMTHVTSTRVEYDSLGPVNVPGDKLWGAQTQRSLEYFSIGDDLIPREMIPAYAIVKKAAGLVNHKAGLLDDIMRRYDGGAAVTMGILAATCVPALAMQPAGTQGGYQVGAEIGANLTDTLRFGAAADVNVGFKTNWFGQAHTDAVADVLTTSKYDTNQWIATAGIRQPLPISGSIPISVEGGLSYVYFSNGSSASTAGPFLGARATFGQSGAMGITAMGRYHFENGGFYQLGAGVAGPLMHGTGLYYQADYYRLGGSGILQSDVIMAGVRWSGR